MNPIIQQQFDRKLPKPGKTGLDWYLFSYFAQKYNNKKLLEIGVGDGGSLFTLLAHSNDVTAIDNWNYGWGKSPIVQYANNLNKFVKFIDEDSNSVRAEGLETYNFIHLDANKGYEGVIKDLELCDKITDDTVCVDDYMNSMWPEVTWAVTDFLETHSNWKIILVGNHQIFLSKQNVQIKEIITDFPVVYRNNILYLTYGALPDYTKPYIDNGAMKYTWHDTAWK